MIFGKKSFLNVGIDGVSFKNLRIFVRVFWTGISIDGFFSLHLLCFEMLLKVRRSLVGVQGNLWHGIEILLIL